VPQGVSRNEDEDEGGGVEPPFNPSGEGGRGYPRASSAAFPTNTSTKEEGREVREGGGSVGSPPFG